MKKKLYFPARSQHRMRFGNPGDPADIAAKVVPLLDQHQNATLELLRRSPQIDLLEIDYPALIQDPAPALAQIVRFLGPAALPHAEAMAGVIDARLHLQRV